MAGYLDVPTTTAEGEPRAINEITHDVALAALAEFGKSQWHTEIPQTRASRSASRLWQELRIAPRSIDREVVEMLHRTHMGNDQDAEHLLDQAMRAGLADGWGGSMLGTDISDILFGTPGPIQGEVGLGVLSEDEVNIVLHGHEPTLSEMIVIASQDPELIEYAKSKGAKGIALSGLCCTANEIIMREGIPTAGNMLQQELAILTGAVETMIVDVQCIMQGLVPVAERYHTEVITTSPKTKITGATHIEFEEGRALEIAKQIVRRSIDRFPMRGKTYIPKDDRHRTIPGFSHEYIGYALGGTYRGSFRPLNDAIAAGRIRGVVANIGCTNSRVQFESFHRYLTEQFIKNDILVVETGCASVACQKLGYMTPEAALEIAGPGLREVCEAVGIAPVLAYGLLRGQLAHPDRALADGHRRRPGRGHLGHSGRGHGPRVDERKSHLDRHLLRRFRRLCHHGHPQPGGRQRVCHRVYGRTQRRRRLGKQGRRQARVYHRHGRDLRSHGSAH